MNLKNNIFKNLGQNSFNLGGFFLVTALPISTLFFLISIFSSFLDKNNIQFKNKYNLILFIVSLLMIIKNIFLNLSNYTFSENIRLNMWLDLINWIPFFLIFVACQKYLLTINQRNKFSKIFIAGTIPFFFSCILQFWFNIYGPFETLNGLIVWFQKPMLENHGGVTGLFSNQNYAGLWLTTILPFFFSQEKISKYKLFLFFLILINIYLIFLTTSKNAFLGLLVIIISLYKYRSRIFKLVTLIFLSCILFFNLFNNLNFININFAPFQVYEKISTFNFFDSSRFDIFKIAAKLIIKKPIWGWGKSLFRDLFIKNGGDRFVEHTHSMPLELAFNYGLPISIILIAFISFLIYKSLKTTTISNSSKEDNYINKCWIISTIVIAISHLNDITYYDGKIAIIFWILLAGTKCIIDNNTMNYKF